MMYNVTDTAEVGEREEKEKRNRLNDRFELINYFEFKSKKVPWIDIILGTREASFVIFDVASADRILRIRPVTSVAIPSPIAEDD